MRSLLICVNRIIRSTETHSSPAHCRSTDRSSREYRAAFQTSRTRPPYSASSIASSVAVCFLGAFLPLVLGTNVATAQTTATYRVSGSGVSTGSAISAIVKFTIVPQTGNNSSLQIDLVNTSPGQSVNRADLLTTLLFNFTSGVGVTAANGSADTTTSLLGITDNPLNHTSQVYTTGAPTTLNPSGNGGQAVNGTWVFGTQIDADRRFTYGVSSAGFTRTNNAATVAPSTTSDLLETYEFTSSAGWSNSDDYAVVGFGVNQAINGKSDQAIIRDGVRVTVGGFTGLSSTSQIASVGFGFASGTVAPLNGVQVYNIQTGTLDPTPAPPGIVSMGIGILVGGAQFGFVRLRKKRRARSASTDH